jgi:hypothetical protein
MKAYENLWVALCAPLTMVGFGVGFMFVALPLTILVVFVGALSAMVTWAWLLQSEDAKSLPRARARAIANNALVGGAAAGALLGYAVLLGAGVVLLVILVLASSPYAVGTYGRWLRAVPTPSVAQLDAMARALGEASPEYLTFQGSSRTDALTDEELCQSWRASYTVLQHQHSAAQMAATVAERQTYLDELERRNPRGFAAWLASGARAPGNPLPYLTRGRADQSAINWDELTRGQDW